MTVNEPALLLLGYGNPGRGDDALGPALVEALERDLVLGLRNCRLDFLCAMQLQPEHAFDLWDHQATILIDACVDTPHPFDITTVKPRRDHSCTTHRLSPGTLLAICRQTLGTAPPCWLLSIRGVRFDLGEGLSGPARRNLDLSLDFLRKWLLREHWREALREPLHP